MKRENTFEVIIIGGSYAGLSAALALARSLRRILIIDSGQPCNSPTPHSHNFLTQDGKTPQEIAAVARKQVLHYDTVNWLNDSAVEGRKTNDGFKITVASGEMYAAQKLIFATGLKDLMPDIDGFAQCWGKSILHCPYCHGYEVRHKPTAVLANGDMAFHFARLISNWTPALSLCTNGKSTLTDEEMQKLKRRKIQVVEREIDRFVHQNGQIRQVVFMNKTTLPVEALYAKPDFVQHCSIPESLGCELTKDGLISVDGFQKTSVEGVFACGDNSGMRSVSAAVASGSKAGGVVNFQLIEETFNNPAQHQNG